MDDTPIAGCFIMENPQKKKMIWGYPMCTIVPPILGNPISTITPTLKSCCKMVTHLAKPSEISFQF